MFEKPLKDWLFFSKEISEFIYPDISDPSVNKTLCE